MLDYSVKIGLVAMRRNLNNRPKGTFLTWHSAEERGRRFTSYIEENFTSEHVSFVDNRGIGIADLVYDDKSAAEVVERFKKEKVDAVFIINCNFGNEEAAADIAMALAKPVLLWAPLDDEYYVDGMRPTDSQCGLFGVARQMQRYHIPFSHLPCSRVDSEEFKESFDSENTKVFDSDEAYNKALLEYKASLEEKNGKEYYNEIVYYQYGMEKILSLVKAV
jgi:hypothetical protein